MHPVAWPSGFGKVIALLALVAALVLGLVGKLDLLEAVMFMVVSAAIVLL